MSPRGGRIVFPSTRGGSVSKSVLVVEDPATMREMVSQTLKEAGFEPLVGKNGQDGPKLPLSDGGHHDNRSGR